MNRGPFTVRELQPEHELLLLCARTRLDGSARTRIRRLLGQTLDWSTVLEHASRHGIVPLLHHHLSRIAGTVEGLVPAGLLQALQRASVAGTARTLLLVNELKSLLAEMADAGAPAVAWKGPVLAYSVYPSPELRSFVDLDVLVRRRDVDRARAVLERRGYSPKPGLAMPEEELFARSGHAVPMVHERTGISVDLHWGAAARYFSSVMDSDALCAEAEPLPIGDEAIPALTPEALLLLLSAHGAKHGPFPWPKLKWVTDVEAFLRTYPETEWEPLLARARAAGCLRMVLLGICLARELLHAPLPPAVEAAIRDDPAVLELVPGIRDRLLSDDPPGFAFADRLRFDLAVRERLRDRIRYRTRRLLTTGHRDVGQAPDLPPPLRFLHVPMRLTRLAAKYLLRPSRMRALVGEGRGVRVSPVGGDAAAGQRR